MASKRSRVRLPYPPLHLITTNVPPQPTMDAPWLNTQLPVDVNVADLSEPERKLWDALLEARRAGVESNQITKLARTSWYAFENEKSATAFAEWEKQNDSEARLHAS